MHKFLVKICEHHLAAEMLEIFGNGSLCLSSNVSIIQITVFYEAFVFLSKLSLPVDMLPFRMLQIIMSTKK